MAGLDDVARAAGVSTATVSRALSGRGRTSEETRARVRAAAERLGYVASATASSLASGRAENIGVVVPLMDRWFFATVLDGIASALAPHGYDITLYNLTDDAAQRRRLFDTALRRGRVDGLIVLAVELSDAEVARLSSLGLPVVGLGVPRAELPGLRVDDTAVGRVATEHLLALGHRDIAHIGLSREASSGPLDIPTRRRRGFDEAVAAARKAGSIVTARFAEADFTVEGGRGAASALLSRHDRPTAVFAASDEMAYGVLAAARDRRLSVPGDLSVIGVDGHDLAGLFDLTTIDQFPHAQGERAGAAILAALGVGELGAAGISAAGISAVGAASAPADLPFELMTRGTTAPPSGR